MGFIRKYFGTMALLAGAVLPLVGLMIYADLAKTRSADDLATADRCVDWSHENRDAQLADGPALEGRCSLYFRTRSNEEADEDVERWKRRTARQTLK